MSFSSLLVALGNPKVNYFSLDIEGAELQVLRSVPWNLVDIEVSEDSQGCITVFKKSKSQKGTRKKRGPKLF